MIDHGQFFVSASGLGSGVLLSSVGYILVLDMYSLFLGKSDISISGAPGVYWFLVNFCACSLIVLRSGCWGLLGSGPLNCMSTQSFDHNTASMLSSSGGGGVCALFVLHDLVIAFRILVRKNVNVFQTRMTAYLMASVAQAGQQHHRRQSAATSVYNKLARC